jgi:FkbM family methyltransferase
MKTQKNIIDRFYSAVLKLLYRSENFMVENIKFKIRKGTIDEFIIKEIWKHKEYTPSKLKKFRINKSDTVVDIGANIGIFTIFAANKAKNGIIYSYEPVPENFDLLKKNIEMNNFKNIKIYKFAVLGKKGEVKISLSNWNDGMHSVGIRGIKVSGITLEDIFLNNKIKKINFLKIDCEGSEYDILINTPEEYLKKIEKISMEFHDFGIYDIPSLKGFLETNGFQTIVKRNLLSYLPIKMFRIGMIYASSA